VSGVGLKSKMSKGGGAPPLASAPEGPRRTPPNGGDPRNAPGELGHDPFLDSTVRKSHPLVSLDSLFEIARGGSPRPIQDFLTDDPAGINWISISDAPEGAKYITNVKRRIKTDGVKKSRMVYPGDFLLTNSMSFGRPYILKTEGCIHDGWLVLSPRDTRVYPDFFFYLLSSDAVYAEFERLAAGATVKNLNIDLVKGIKIPLPPLPEQRRIAEVLDRAEGLRAKRREAISLLDIMTQVIFVDLFGNPVSNPKTWTKRKFGDVGTLDRGISKHRPRNAPELLGGVHPLIQTGDVSNCNGYIGNFTSTYSDFGLKQSKMWPAGTLCITIAANIAKTGILAIDACFPDSVVGFSADDQATVEYVRTWLSFLQKSLEDNAPESAQKNINLAILRDLDIPFPPLSLQQEFASRIAAVEKLKAAHRASLSHLDALFASLQHRAFRGEL
jgi:type I restriction enzyme, S subunit